MSSSYQNTLFLSFFTIYILVCRSNCPTLVLHACRTGCGGPSDARVAARSDNLMHWKMTHGTRKITTATFFFVLPRHSLFAFNLTLTAVTLRCRAKLVLPTANPIANRLASRRTERQHSTPSLSHSVTGTVQAEKSALCPRFFSPRRNTHMMLKPTKRFSVDRGPRTTPCLRVLCWVTLYSLCTFHAP